MARILLVGNFAHKSMGLWCYNSDRRIQNGLLRNNNLVWDFSDRDVARASNIFANRKLGVRATNKKLLQTIENLRPDIIILGHANIIKSDTLAQAKKTWPHLRIGVFNFDPLFNRDNVRALESRMDVADAIFITSAGEGLRKFKTATNIVGYLPNPVDPAIDSGRAFAKTDQPFDIFHCIGAPESPSDPRLTHIEFLLQNFPDLRIDYYGLLGNPNILGGAYLDALQNNARIGLNISRRNDIPWYCSDRAAHLFGNGLLVAVPETIGWRHFFTDQEAVFFQSPAELGEKITAMKNDDARRQVVAEAGWKKYYALFNSQAVTKYMLEMITGQKLDPSYPWAKEVYA